MQDKEVTITQNGESTVTKDSGYDGLNTVSITTAVPQPSGKITITENGTDIDVSSYASADVIVPSQKYAPRRITFISWNGNELNYELANLDISNMVAIDQMFYNCGSITSIDLSQYNWDTSNINDFKYMFYYCLGLTTINISNLKNANNSDISRMFGGCTSLQFLDMRNFDFTICNTYTELFGKDAFTYVPANCLIIVKDATQKQWIRNNFSRMTNVKTVAEYEG